MFTEAFCNIILYPAIFEGTKLGTGMVWKALEEKKEEGRLSNTDILLYTVIKSFCRNKLGTRVSEDKLYAVCEILCNNWLRERSIEQDGIKSAMEQMEIYQDSKTIAQWKKELEEEIRKYPELVDYKVIGDLDRILEILESREIEKYPEAAMLLEERVDFSRKIPQFFANDSSEKTVYSYEMQENGCKVSISFEPRRTRPISPRYSGIFYLFTPPVNIMGKNILQMSMTFLDAHIGKITLELKKAGHTEPDDEKKYDILNTGNHTMEYRIDLKDCPDKIKNNLGEIVLATYVEDFCDENKLETEILLQRIEFL